MLKNQRLRQITALLEESGGFLSTAELCRRLYASPSSIRRDLALLEKEGEVKRSYGGAERICSPSHVVAFSRRDRINAEAKEAIAEKAVTLVKEHDVIFLDSSSTAFHLAGRLREYASLTVVTNSVAVLSLLSDSRLRVIATGGRLSDDNRTCLIGSDAESTFRMVRADLAFFSCRSVDENGRISDCTREEILVRNAMLENADRRIFLCDSHKFFTRSPYRQGDLGEVDVLISEGKAEAAFGSRFPSLKIL